MLRLITMILNIIAIILRRKPAMKAREVLPEESPTAEAIEEGEKRAEEKFGPRP